MAENMAKKPSVVGKGELAGKGNASEEEDLDGNVHHPSNADQLAEQNKPAQQWLK